MGIIFLAGGLFWTAKQQPPPEEPQFINQSSIGVWGPVQLTLPNAEDSTVASDFKIQVEIQPPLPFIEKQEDGQTALWFSVPADPDTQYTLLLEYGGSETGNPSTYEWTFTPRPPQVTYLEQGNKGAELWLVSTDQSHPTSLTSTNYSILDYEIAPDGQDILLSVLNSQDGSDVWITGRDGSDMHQLVACENSTCTGMSYLPYKEGFAFVKTLASPSDQPGSQILFYDTHTQAISILFEQPGRPVRDLKWSPDANILAFYNEEDSLIYFYGRDTQIVESVPCFASETGGWSADGNLMTFACAESQDAEPCRPLKQVDISSLEISPSPLHDILGNRDYSAPLWSFDGKWIAFGERCLSDRPTRQLWLVNAENYAGSQITDDLLYNFANYQWDPTSRLLVFQRFEMGSASAAPDILLWRFSTEQLELLAKNGHSPAWLP